MRRLIYIIFILSFTFPDVICLLSNMDCYSTVNAQTNTDRQLANQYYRNGEFDKAVVLFENFYNKTHLDYYYKYYLNCLLQLKEYSKAEKLVNKQIKKKPGNLSYQVDLGFVFESSGETNKSKQQYAKTIKQLTPDRQQVTRLANAFLSIGSTDYAITAYIEGKKLLKGSYYFNQELASVYARADKISLMINEYLDLLNKQPNQGGLVQSALSSHIGAGKVYNKKNEILKTQLLKQIQKHPDKIVFSEMLIWLFVQQKNFEMAFVQVKALDRRLKEDGIRLMNLAKLSETSKDYDVAVKCYKYVINKGKHSYYYINSKMELLNVMNKKITGSRFSRDDLADLEKNYFSTIQELGKSPRTISLLKGLAHLQAFYLHKTDSAAKLLEETIKIPQIHPKILAECKIELADILLLKGDIWDASLYYSQVEKAFKHEPIGHEAKYRNAKLSYYKGEFEWAQAQLDVLKASTSKLIANDALDLSLLISDNTALDTSTTALLMYANADLLAYQNKDKLALATLDSISNLFPGHSLEDEVLYKKAQILIKNDSIDDALTILKIIVSQYSYDILADDALFMLADLYEMRLSNSEMAMELYQELLINFPGSLYVVEARKRFRKLRGDPVN